MPPRPELCVPPVTLPSSPLRRTRHTPILPRTSGHSPTTSVEHTDSAMPHDLLRIAGMSRVGLSRTVGDR